MRHPLIGLLVFLAFCPFAFFCSKNKATVSTTDSARPMARANTQPFSAQDSGFTSRTYFYSIVAPAGCSLKVRHDGEDIDIVRDKHQVLHIGVLELRSSYDIRWATTLDSLDAFRGFAMTRALTPLFGEPDGCHPLITIDSMTEFKNPFGLRCLRISATDKTICDEDTLGPGIRVEGYFVDITRGKNIRLIQIMNTSETPDRTELCKEVSRNIRLIQEGN